MITAATRVSDALARRPELRDVLSAFHPAFARLHHPVLGRVLPKLVTVADAARIAGVDVDALVAVMNCPVGPPAGAEAPRAAHLPPAPRGPAEPAPPWFDAARVTVFDARPILAAGEDPLAAILKALRAVPAGGQLTVVAPFEPVPLVGLLGRQGWGAWTRWEGDACHVTFGRGAPTAAAPEEDDAAELAEFAVAVDGGWEVDVRELAPPEPMRRVLAAADAGRLPLRILHAREPALLWPHLQERGLAWTITHTPEAVVIDVRRR